jgi:GntR family transcriptional regulator
VVKAYAELEHEGLVVRRQGMGTFVAAVSPAGVLVAPAAVRDSLLRWVRRAGAAGLSREQIRLLVSIALDDEASEEERVEGGVA